MLSRESSMLSLSSSFFLFSSREILWTSSSSFICYQEKPQWCNCHHQFSFRLILKIRKEPNEKITGEVDKFSKALSYYYLGRIKDTDHLQGQNDNDTIEDTPGQQFQYYMTPRKFSMV